jgi:hypothetical protein
MENFICDGVGLKEKRGKKNKPGALPKQVEANHVLLYDVTEYKFPI